LAFPPAVRERSARHLRLRPARPRRPVLTRLPRTIPWSVVAIGAGSVTAGLYVVHGFWSATRVHVHAAGVQRDASLTSAALARRLTNRPDPPLAPRQPAGRRPPPPGLGPDRRRQPHRVASRRPAAGPSPGRAEGPPARARAVRVPPAVHRRRHAPRHRRPRPA